MSQIGRERILHTFAHVFERNSDTEFVVLLWEEKGIFRKNPYLLIGGNV